MTRKVCSSSATQRRHAGSNCHPPVFFWNIPKGVKLREYSENTHFTGGAQPRRVIAIFCFIIVFICLLRELHELHELH